MSVLARCGVKAAGEAVIGAGALGAAAGADRAARAAAARVKGSGTWVFKDTRMPVSTVFENLESGATIDEIMEWFDVTREQIVAVLEFAARSLGSPSAPSSESRSAMPVNAHSV